MSDGLVADTLARHARGELSPGMALSRLLLACRDLDRLRADLEADGSAAALDLLGTLEANRTGAGQALAILAGAPDDPPPATSLDEGLERCRRLFDGAVAVNAAASVALYSLGDERLLERATDEVVGLAARLGLLGSDRDLLDIGCGIGRFERALAGRVASITGVDVSPAMIEAARTRCAGLPNVRLLETSGRNLADFRDGSFDLVLAVDSFPYLYQAGSTAFAAAWVREIARVLRPDSHALLLNLSYRGELEQDRADARRFADEAGLRMVRNGTADLRSWDGRTFLLRRAR